jgi:hypothetical protein
MYRQYKDFITKKQSTLQNRDSSENIIGTIGILPLKNRLRVAVFKYVALLISTGIPFLVQKKENY